MENINLSTTQHFDEPSKVRLCPFRPITNVDSQQLYTIPEIGFSLYPTSTCQQCNNQSDTTQQTTASSEELANTMNYVPHFVGCPFGTIHEEILDQPVLPPVNQDRDQSSTLKCNPNQMEDDWFLFEYPCDGHPKEELKDGASSTAVWGEFEIQSLKDAFKYIEAKNHEYIQRYESQKWQKIKARMVKAGCQNWTVQEIKYKWYELEDKKDEPEDKWGGFEDKWGEFEEKEDEFEVECT